jgi:hypothetical protein
MPMLRVPFRPAVTANGSIPKRARIKLPTLVKWFHLRHNGLVSRSVEEEDSPAGAPSAGIAQAVEGWAMLLSHLAEGSTERFQREGSGIISTGRPTGGGSVRVIGHRGQRDSLNLGALQILGLVAMGVASQPPVGEQRCDERLLRRRQGADSLP